MKDGDVKILPSHTVRLSNGQEVTVKNVVVHMYLLDWGDGEKWEECFPCETMERIEAAIERQCPGYFRQ